MARRKRATLKELGLVGPHPVDRRLGFVDAIRYNHTDLYPAGKCPSGHDLDAMRVGRIEDGRRYLGGNCWERIKTP